MAAVYLDCNASAPVDPVVADRVNHWLTVECGNASSRTHEFGVHAKRAVARARKEVATVVSRNPEEVLFTSGATEANNLAILGLAPWCERTGRKHLITSAIEHSAVLEPIMWLRDHAGFRVTVLPVSGEGYVSPEELKKALSPDTALISIMHVNNETGVIQPLREFATVIADHPAVLHIDAAQGFGKELSELRNQRIDMLSCTAHKIYGPQGVGALILSRREGKAIPLQPITFGGGQERGLRPGTLPTALIVGFGEAAALAVAHHASRREKNLAFRKQLFDGLGELPITTHGAEGWVLPHVTNLSVEGVSSEAAMVALRDLIAVSNGSACTSARYEPSHVLQAMGLTSDQLDGAMRISWCHLTPAVDWAAVRSVLAQFL